MVLGYFPGYEGQGDWNAYSRYTSLDGGMAQVSTSFLFSRLVTNICIFRLLPKSPLDGG